MDSDILMWMTWKDNPLSYADTLRPGMKKWLNEIEVLPNNPKGIDYSSGLEKWNNLDKESLWRGIKACTAGGARQIVEATVDENGDEAWFELNRNFEPAMEANRIRAVGDMYSMHAYARNTLSVYA